MDKVVIAGLGYLDGEYPFNLVGLLTIGHNEAFTNRELHRIKTMTGLRSGEFVDALDTGDNDFTVAVAATVLTRHGKKYDEDLLWDAPAGAKVTFEFGEDEDSPPAVAEPTPPKPNSDGSASESGESRTSGTDSEQPSVSLASVPNPTGTPASDTPATSDQETLAS